MGMKRMVGFTDQSVGFSKKLWLLAEYKAAILWARAQLRIAFAPLGIELRGCYLCGSLRWPCNLERNPWKIARVISRNFKGDVRECAWELANTATSTQDYIDELTAKYPEYRVFFERVRFSDMDATIVPYRNGEVWSRYNLDEGGKNVLDQVNSEVDRRFNIAPSYSAIEIGYPALKHKCTNISLIPIPAHRKWRHSGDLRCEVTVP